jgi:hypothetical protein
MMSQTTSLCGLKLQVYEALRYKCRVIQEYDFLGVTKEKEREREKRERERQRETERQRERQREECTIDLGVFFFPLGVSIC